VRRRAQTPTPTKAVPCRCLDVDDGDVIGGERGGANADDVEDVGGIATIATIATSANVAADIVTFYRNSKKGKVH
jgi:hypothetical protein